MDGIELTGVEVLGWYDGVAFYMDGDGNRYSKITKQPIGKDELCRFGKIYKVEWIDPDNYKIISEREDE